MCFEMWCIRRLGRAVQEIRRPAFSATATPGRWRRTTKQIMYRMIAWLEGNVFELK
jgi:hypothetical protein